MQIRFAIIYDFDRRGLLKQDGTAPILIRSYLKGKTKYFNTGIYIPPKQWHKKYAKVVHHPNQFEMNKAIQDQIHKMEKFSLDIIEREGSITLNRLADFDLTKTDQTFLDFYQDQIDKEKKRLAHSTFTDYTQTFDKLQEYKSNICFSEITVPFVKDFVNFLHNEDLSQNTVHKHYKNFRKYINLAIQYGYLDANANPCKRVKVKTTPTDRLYLTEHELAIFEQFVIPAKKEHWQVAKDIFLFSCYTGLRFCDIATIRTEHFIKTDDGLLLFHTAQKTKKPYNQNLRKLFPNQDKLMSRPEEIVRRRLRDRLHKDDPVFVYTCRYAYAKQLKKMAAEMNMIRERVKKEISSHVGRHTFGTIMAGIVEIHILKELMQHSNIRETMIYVHMNRKMIEKALDRAEWF